MQTLTCGSQWPAPRLDTGLDSMPPVRQAAASTGEPAGVGALPKAGHSRDTTHARGVGRHTDVPGLVMGIPREGSVCSRCHQGKRSTRHPISMTNIFLWYTLHISFDRPCCISHLYKSNTLKISIGQLNINHSNMNLTCKNKIIARSVF